MAIETRSSRAARLAAGLIKAALSAAVIPAIFSRRRERRIIAWADGLMARFNKIPDLGIFEEARPRIFGGTRRPGPAVLLLHGFSASPGQFEALMPALERAGIAYYAPLLTGFGTDDYRLLKVVRPADWLRDAAAAYEVLAALYERVSVVGHSMGGVLAAWLAAEKPVQHLILTDPYLVPPPQDKRWSRRFRDPIQGPVLRWWAPMYAKEATPDRPWATDIADPVMAERAFHQPAMPTNAGVALWDLVDLVDISRARFESLTVIYGVNDDSADIPAFIDILNRNSIPHTALAFERSGHNVLQDFDRDEAARKIVSVLEG